MGIIGYAIKSTSDEGIYYLCNGWNKHKTFWVDESKIHKAIFKTRGQAKASLTKLLKIMEDYKSDFFQMAFIFEDGTINLEPLA